jgi:hypothetical protein
VSLLLHISINFKDQFDGDALKKELNKAIDWIHYMPNCWIVLTSNHADIWWLRLYPLLKDNDFMLISPIDPAATRGWLPQWAIDWFEAARVKVQEIGPEFIPDQKQLPLK